MVRITGEDPHPTSNTLWQPNNALRKASLTVIAPGSVPCLINSNASLVALFISSLCWKPIFQASIKQWISATNSAA